MAVAKPKAKTKKGVAQDRSKVSGTQKYEVDYEAKKMGVTPDQVKAAIKKVGNDRKKIEAELKKLK